MAASAARGRVERAARRAIGGRSPPIEGGPLTRKLERTAMLYVDIPSRSEFSDLVSMRGGACVSIYLETTPVTRDTEASRIELGNLIREAERQLKEINFDKRRLAALTSELRNLVEDGTFWITQANSLAIFATPDRLRTYRLANKLVSMVQVADRFHLKPLFRAITFTHSAFVLALSENAVRPIELNAEDRKSTRLNY